jgi:hypothetical protein
MKFAETLLAAGLAATLSGCVFSGKPKTAKAAPAPPKPAAAPAPTPLPQPISIPQTNVQLPPQQPVSPEALATTQPKEEAPSEPAPVRTPPRHGPHSPPKPVEAAAPTITAPPPEERQPIQEVLPPGELKRLMDEADARRRDALRVLDQVQTQRLNATQRSVVDRVLAFLKQSEEAKQRGDMRQASELAGRALVLAKELQP